VLGRAVMICLECGRELIRITTTHLRVCCGMAIAAYRIKHPDVPIVNSEYERTVSKEKRRRRQAEYKLRWQQNNPVAYKKSMDKWLKANPDKVNERSKKYYEKHPDKAKLKARRINLRRNYGITLEQYEMMLDAQDGVCVICKREETVAHFTHLSIDHCHRTGEIRGILCSRCNIVIGQMNDNPELLRKAAEYLERYQ